MFVVNCSVLGTILSAILVVIDTILGLAGAGFTFSGWITEVIAKMLYHYDLVVDAGQDTGGLEFTLAQPDKGLMSGNGIQVGLTLTSVVTHTHPHGISIGYSYYWSEDYLKAASLVYELSPEIAATTGISTSSNARKDDWMVTPDHMHLSRQLYKGIYTDTLTGQTALPAAGVNRTLSPFNVNVGFSMPGVSC
jgi:hypothetical protein